MKKRIIWGISVGFLVVALLGCPQPTDSNSTPSGNLGGTLKLSGKVYLADETVEYTGTTGVAGGGSTGKIENRQLTFEIGTPTGLSALTDSSFASVDPYDGIKPAAGSTPVNFIILNLTTTLGGNTLSKGRTTKNSSGYKDERAMFIYVSNGVTLEAKGKTTLVTDSKTGQIYNVVSTDTKLNLKQGWNEIYMVGEQKSSGGTYSWKIGNPSGLRWVVE